MMAHGRGCWIGALVDPPCVARPFLFPALEPASVVATALWTLQRDSRIP